MFEGYGESDGDIELGLPLRRCPRICKRVSGLTIKYGYSSRFNIPGILLSRLVAFGSNRVPSDTTKGSSGSNRFPSDITSAIFTESSNLWPCGTKDKVCKRPNVDSYLLTSPVTAVGVVLFLFSTGKQYNPTQSGIKDSGCHEAHRGARPRH